MTPALRKRLVQLAFVILLQAVLLFTSAGTLKWTSAWVYLVLYIAYIGMNAIILLPRPESREMIEERAQVKEGSKGWDKIIGVIIGILGPAILIIAGLDFRFGWSGKIPPWVQVACYIVLVLGYALFGWAMVSNRFFSSVVRIQKERGHTVETGGPYAFVRHPGYTSLLVSYLCIPPALGSLWAFIPVVFLVINLIIRTRLEDRTLQNELEGYKDYTLRVQYRLIPGVW